MVASEAESSSEGNLDGDPAMEDEAGSESETGNPASDATTPSSDETAENSDQVTRTEADTAEPPSIDTQDDQAKHPSR